MTDTTPLNFRGGPGLNWPNFTAIPVGDCAVELTDIAELAANGRPWRFVGWHGEEGWVSDLFIEPVSAAPGGAVLRSRCGLLETTLDPMYSFVEVTETACAPGWAFVRWIDQWGDPELALFAEDPTRPGTHVLVGRWLDREGFALGVLIDAGVPPDVATILYAAIMGEPGRVG